ncbi:MAG: SET domain-containing protein-lysine N-methyltransferase [Bacteroidetes bacterium]|nr:SET domain-containing protein-lysine N-methyltransferase [Bacteroidota bacterium]
MSKLYLKEVKGKGRGVFCSRDIAVGDTIEVCPLIVVPADSGAAIDETKLADYSFYFNKEERTLSLVMGFGSMYNYARYPNTIYELDRERRAMTYTAFQDIPAHTEITINYGGEYGYDYGKWFVDRGFVVIG